jgi:cytochrome c
MDFLTQHVIPPTATHLKLLEFLAVVTYTIHLPYIAMVIGSTAVAMWLTFSDHEIPNPRFARLADDLTAMVFGSKLPMLVLGILPLGVLPFIYVQWFSGLEGVPLHYIVLPIPGVAVGLLILQMYRGTFRERASNFHMHMAMGTAGLGLLMASYFVLMSAVTRLQDPEKWYRLKNVVIMLLNWNVIWKYMLFIHMGFGLTGAAILFFILRWQGDRALSDPDYATFARRFGAGMGLAFCFAVPVFNLFYVFTSPDVVFDSTVYVIGASICVVTMFIAYAFFAALRASGPRFGATVFTLFMVVFVLSSTFDVRSMANANREHARLLEQKAEAQTLEREVLIEQSMAAASGKNLGEETFNSVCMQCHRMDEKLVGPALATVLPKHPTVESLTGFVMNPTKVDPAYPPMPNPGLSPAQARAVATYLLGQAGMLEGGGEGGEQNPETEVESGQTSH